MYMGHLLLAQGKNREALENYEEELTIAQKKAENHEYDLAEAHVNVGNAKHDLGDLEGALSGTIRKLKASTDESAKVQIWST